MAPRGDSTLSFINAAIQEIKDDIKEINKKIDDKIIAIYDARIREIETDVTDLKARVKLVFAALGAVALGLLGLFFNTIFNHKQ